MKCMLIAILLSVASACFSQETKITITDNKEILHISLDSNNENNLFLIHAAQFSNNDFLIIKVDSDSAYKDWKRSFFIYDSANTAIKDFVLMKDETYCLKLNELKKLLVIEEPYFIYTTAIPKDPQKAMLVKVAKQLVCKIKIL
jgi:protease II